MTWSFEPASGQTNPANVLFYTDEGGILASLTKVLLPGQVATTPSTPGAASYTSAFAGSLLGGLLGGDYYVGLRVQEGTWTSKMMYARATIGLLGLGNSCTVSPVPFD